MCITCNILCFAIATTISNFDSETCNTPPKRLWKGRAGLKCQDLRQCTLKVPCRCTKQCIIRIPQLHRIQGWSDLNQAIKVTKSAFFYFLMLILLFVVHNCRNEEINLTKSDFFINIFLFVIQNFV